MTDKLRVLDLFSGGQDHLADNASCLKVHGMLGIISRPSQESCFYLTAKLRYGGALGGGQYPALGFPRMIDKREGRQGTLNKSGSGFHPGHVSQPPLHNTRPFVLGSACRSLIGFRGRSEQSIRQSNAIGSRQPYFQVQTASRTVGNASSRGRRPFFASIETSPCIPSSTTSTWHGLPYTRTHNNRSVLRFLP